jgi:hypothetical protein
MPGYEDLPRNDNGTIRVVDRDIIDADRLKGEPKTDAEAAERYRIMQAAQLLRYVSSDRG